MSRLPPSNSDFRSTVVVFSHKDDVYYARYVVKGEKDMKKGRDYAILRQVFDMAGEGWLYCTVVHELTTLCLSEMAWYDILSGPGKSVESTTPIT